MKKQIFTTDNLWSMLLLFCTLLFPAGIVLVWVGQVLLAGWPVVATVALLAGASAVLFATLWGLMAFYAGARCVGVRPLFAWYDLWIGLYIDRKNNKLYLLPVPCVGICLEFGVRA